ncbi:hypothetical protein SERLA73DRAFT_179973 [Serpula lacrymans var. lacrymans S7.3]|uniref:Adhesin domain-containing protein n=2 Tax=Serpula lacrymans var. lacrymans TaxID=341189 RepID=F8PV80_SERL3|nr:uncharacterized protein SERLADRAFT_465355 [Serpula lacrymans var. lacrymans S7.9]EGN99772.1 hypothetical protein SERLA73DRAFT_179973 [Serpula lacrymans var. lacrymans S7.3]EGO25347.1 hypothetical protein SERLADRAFT_465355 [Serpula lacrymans var. lacrymans S7.9]
MPFPRRNTNNNNNGGLGFFTMVAAVTAGLKLKERWDDYRAIPGDEGRLALHSPVDPAYMDEEDNIGLNNSATSNGFLSTEIPQVTAPKRKRSKKWCICCGLDCGLFWKAFGIVLLITIVWNGLKFGKWLVTPSPTGLEGLPAYGASLGCPSASHIYMGSKTNFTVPVGTESEHSLEISGIASGTLVVAEGASDATEIVYELILRRDDSDSFDDTSVGSTQEGQFVLQTPVSGSFCMRYDMTVYIPRNLKKLQLASRSTTQLKFATEGNVVLDDMSVTLYASNDNLNLLLPNTNIQATRMSLEVWRGWVVGDISIVNSTTIQTRNGDGVTNVHVHPDPQSSDVAYLETISGAGRTDVFYESDPSRLHRVISSTHTCERKGDMYLTYKEAEFNGQIDLKSQSFTGHGVQGMISAAPGRPNSELPWVGNKDGGDSLKIRSPQGWVGLYF